MSPSSFLHSIAQGKLAHPYSLFFGFFSGSLLAIWLTTYVISHKQYLQYHHVVDNFGQVMAAMAARQAVGATLNHDRLSLQVLLEDITQHRAIVSSAVYDVENKLIVQAAGTTKQYKDQIRYFGAPITLHDTISGHVVLAVDTTHPSSVHYTILLLVIAGILAVLALFCLYRGVIEVQFDDSGEVQQAGPDKVKNDNQKDRANTILLTLKIKNFDTLYQQLNSDSREKITNQLFQDINKALNLYNGVLTYVGSSSIVISFEQSGFEQQSAILNAIYCGHIVGELNKQHSAFPLQLTALIHHAPEKMIAAEQPSLLHYKDTDDTANLAVEKILLEDSNLESYVLINSELEKNSDHFIEIHSFQEKYAELLNNQLKHLQAIDK